MILHFSWEIVSSLMMPPSAQGAKMSTGSEWMSARLVVSTP
jgi:hypothetical protein